MSHRGKLWHPRRIALGLSVLLVLTSCSTVHNSSTSKDDLTIAIDSDPTTLVPVTPSATGRMVGCLIYQGLTRVNKDGTVEPQLAKSWDVSQDGLQYTFHLVSAKWQDGEPFTAQDVVYSLTQVIGKYSSTFAQSAADTESVTATDDKTVVVKLKKPFGAYLFTLSCDLGGAPIVAEHVLKGQDVMTSPKAVSEAVGTGPFKLSKIAHGQSITLVKNDSYWRKDDPKIDGITLRIISDPSARTVALLAGEVDWMHYYYFNTSDADQVKKAGLQVVDQGPPSQQYLVFNLRHKDMANLTVRQALTVALDRNFLANAYQPGLGGAGETPIDARIKYAYNSSANFMQLYPYDAAKAKQLLAQAGFGPSHPLSVSLTYDSTRRAAQQTVEAIAQQWSAVGVKTKLVGAETAVDQKQTFVDHDFDVTLQGYSSFGDPALGVSRMFTSSNIGTNVLTNAGAYSNPRVDQLFEQGAEALSLQDRGKYYSEAQTILAHDIPSIPLIESVNLNVGKPDIHGIYNGLQMFGEWFDGVSITQGK